MLDIFKRTLLTLFIPSLLLAGCELIKSAGVKPQQIPVKMQVNMPSSKMGNTGPHAASVDTLTRLKILISGLGIEQTGGQDSLSLDISDKVADLPLDEREVTLAEATLPSGKYDTFSIKIEDASDDSDIDDPDLVEGEADSLRYSLMAAGVYNGNKFEYKSQAEFELDLDLDPVLEIAESGSSDALKILIDLNWFTDPDTGEPLNPNDASDREQINQNIKNSIKAHEVDSG